MADPFARLAAMDARAAARDFTYAASPHDVLLLADDHRAAASALRAVLDLHSRYEGRLPSGEKRLTYGLCDHCGRRWPCPTVAAITAALTDDTEETDRA